MLNQLSYTPSESEYNRLLKIITKAIEERDNAPESAIEAQRMAEEHAKRIVDYVYLLKPETYPIRKKLI
jgi:hypothetical protein